MIMGAIQQYLELFDANREVIDRGSAGAVNALRDAARKALEREQLPDKSVEGYEKTSVDEMFAPDYGVNIGRVNMPVDIARTFRCDVPNLSTMLAVVANDAFVPTDTLLNNLPEGVKVMSMVEAAKQYPEFMESRYGKVAPLSDVAVALNSMLAQDGVVIWLSKGVKLSKPIQVVNILASEFPLMAVRRVLIVAEADSSADFIFCDHSQSAEVDVLTTEVVEVVAERNASVSILDMEESSAHTHRLYQLYAHIYDDAKVVVNCATLLNGVTRNEYNLDIKGSNADGRLYGMAIASGNQHIDNNSNVVHSCGKSSSDQRFRYVLDDSATGAFEGGIEVATGAKGTVAYQNNGNVLASSKARMYSKPRLLIYNDDVKCSHGSSTGQLDETALFYMQTRGIPRDDARTMLMQAFVTDVIEEVRPEAARDRLRHLVEKRFAGTLATCHSCGHSCR